MLARSVQLPHCTAIWQETDVGTDWQVWQVLKIYLKLRTLSPHLDVDIYQTLLSSGSTTAGEQSDDLQLHIEESANGGLNVHVQARPLCPMS
jgi:hypothetical protein